MSLDAMDKRQKTKFKAKVLTCAQGPWEATPIDYGFRGISLGMAVFRFKYVCDGLHATMWLCVKAKWE